MNQTANQTEGRNKSWKVEVDGVWKEFDHFPIAKKAYEDARDTGKKAILCRGNGVLIVCSIPDEK